MKSFKSYLLILESFKDAERKWFEKNQKYSDSPDELKSEITEYINLFKELNKAKQIPAPKNDISYWIPKSFESFKEWMNQYRGAYQAKQVEKNKASKGAKQIFENDKVRVYHITTHEASCKYGAGTKWCITERSSMHWDSYIKHGIMFYFIIKKRANDSVYDKVAFAVYPDGRIDVYNAEDDNIPIRDSKLFLKNNNIPEDIFKPKELTLDEIKTKVIESADTPMHWYTYEWRRCKLEAGLFYALYETHYADDVFGIKKTQLEPIPIKKFVEDNYIFFFTDGSVWFHITDFYDKQNYVLESLEDFWEQFKAHYYFVNGITKEPEQYENTSLYLALVYTKEQLHK